jgi:glycosyltransferase involved in cell wall biosynthesis
MKVAVVTPTIGSEYLIDALNSVQNQSYENLVHYLFIDGENHYDKVHPQVFQSCGKRMIKTIELEENVGKGWYGHRVYAACSFLVNADIICYLDEDNWYEPCHVQKLVNKIEEGNQWAFSLRKIYEKTGNFICEDNCESLGKWPVYFNDSVYHIDTSCFAVRRDVAVAVGHAWYGQWGADRQFFGTLKKYFNKYDCTSSHTVCYRLDGNPNSVTREFFEKGNEVYALKYDNHLPWKSKNLITLGS